MWSFVSSVVPISKEREKNEELRNICNKYSIPLE